MFGRTFMPLFDVSTLSSEDMPVQLISTVNLGIDRLRARRVSKIETGIMPHDLINSSTLAFLQAHARRALMFIEGGYDAYLAKRGLVAYSCARAICETFACVMDFCDKLTDHLAEGDFEKTACLVCARSFATRSKDYVSREVIVNEVLDNTAVSILTQIDRVSRRLPDLELKEDYERLCEVVHPNGLGALSYFSIVEDDGTKFSDNGYEDQLVIRALVRAGYLLFLMDRAITLIEAKLARQFRFKSSLSRRQEKFAITAAGFGFLMQNKAGDRVACFVARQTLLRFANMPVRQKMSAVEFKRLFERYRSVIELTAGMLYDRGRRRAGKHQVVVNWFSADGERLATRN
jgi:hypothetical protein